MAIEKYLLGNVPSHVVVFHRGRKEGVIPYEDVLRLQELRETNPHGRNISITDKIQYAVLANLGLVEVVAFSSPHSGFLVTPTDKAKESRFSPVKRS